MKPSRFYVLLIAIAAFSLIPAHVIAAGNGNGNGKGNGNGSGAEAVAATCTVEGNTVIGIGLPGNELLNFMVTDANGSEGWVLGYTSTGHAEVEVAPRTGDTTYEFISRTWGKNGSKYDVFAACTASA